MKTHHQPIEKHPLQPFLPEGARILMLGSFPPKRERWSMDFFYPNWINDMWRIWGLIFFSDKDHFVARSEDGSILKKFDREKCMEFASGKGIAMYDTASEVRRLKDNASDKFLEVVVPTDLDALLEKIPECRAIVTTGQKATDVIVEKFGCEEPSVGDWTECRIPGTDERSVRFWRMPSSSRAYPLPLEKKAEYYRKMFVTEHILDSHEA
ncbi:MAG: uracil-DNA glycosylase family protein [Bacteroidales bacterium]|nr:uracil-DNA glycosylase family protein [Bacteroidales bacterium]